ncbi:hypothetical protein RN001_004002 [Aquatica leii]|uniref:Uncharacterized protein n=1 Tax=Aquatica leii TaxID=1421715 RepID=A0AAN7SEE7_9COLE|nr:hypothetical protein RN001_004002 [Aquatica leii]
MMVQQSLKVHVPLSSLILLLCIGLVHLATFPASIRADWNKFEEYSVTKCMCESGVEPDLVQKMIKFSEYTNDPCFKLYLKCLNIERGLMDANGNMLIDGIVLHLTGATYPIVISCVNQTVTTDPAEKVYQTGKSHTKNNDIKTPNMRENSFPAILFVCIGLANLQSFPQSIRIEWNKFDEYAVTKCMCESGVMPDLVQKMIKNSEYTNDPCFKCYLKCLISERGLMDANGNYIVDALVLHMANITSAVAQLCVNTSITVQDPCQKAYNVVFSVCIGLAYLKSFPLSIRTEWNKFSERAVTKCMCESNVDPDLVQNMIQTSTYASNPCFKCYLRCLGQERGILDRNDNFIVDAMVLHLANVTYGVARTCVNQSVLLQDGCQKTYNVVCISVAYLKTFPQSIRKEWNYFEERAVTKCMCESGVKQELVQKMIDNSIYSNDPCFKCYLKCLIKERGLLDKNENYIVDALVLHLSNMTYAIARPCVNQSALLQDSCQKVFNVGLCLMDSLSV